MKKSKEIYTLLTIASILVAILELIGIFYYQQHILLIDIGHALTHAIIAPWGLYLSTLKVYRYRNSFRNISVGMIGLVSIMSVIASITDPHNHHTCHHGNGYILLVIGIIGILQHSIIHKYHEHTSNTEDHDILCSGLRWHTLADALKSIIFAGMFFIGMITNIELVEPILIWVVRLIILFNGIILLKIFFQNKTSRL